MATAMLRSDSQVEPAMELGMMIPDPEQLGAVVFVRLPSESKNAVVFRNAMILQSADGLSMS